MIFQGYLLCDSVTVRLAAVRCCTAISKPFVKVWLFQYSYWVISWFIFNDVCSGIRESSSRTSTMGPSTDSWGPEESSQCWCRRSTYVWLVPVSNSFDSFVNASIPLVYSLLTEF